jgi:hypothetical protein
MVGDIKLTSQEEASIQQVCWNASAPSIMLWKQSNAHALVQITNTSDKVDLDEMYFSDVVLFWASVVLGAFAVVAFSITLACLFDMSACGHPYPHILARAGGHNEFSVDKSVNVFRHEMVLPGEFIAARNTQTARQKLKDDADGHFFSKLVSDGTIHMCA